MPYCELKAVFLFYRRHSRAIKSNPWIIFCLFSISVSLKSKVTYCQTQLKKMAIEVCILFSCIFVIVIVKADVVCPPPDTYAPCRCTEDLSKLGGVKPRVKLDCFERNLSDSNASNILDVFLSPDISPISILDLSFNQLTRIPSQVRSFPHLQSVLIIHNVIDSIAFGDLNITGRDTTLNFSHNQLTTIAPGAFTGFIIILNDKFISSNK